MSVCISSQSVQWLVMLLRMGAHQAQFGGIGLNLVEWCSWPWVLFLAGYCCFGADLNTVHSSLGHIGSTRRCGPRIAPSNCPNKLAHKGGHGSEDTHLVAPPKAGTWEFVLACCPVLPGPR
eukprot:1072957-Lingulodinium_polyedra.AAC.1